VCTATVTHDLAGDAPEPGERTGAALARVLDQSARDLLARGDDGVEHTLDLIVRGAIATVPHVEQAGISLVERRGRVQSTAPSNELVRELDELQTALREGPCLDAIWFERRTVVDDMAAAHDRWPRWAVAAHDRGVGSLMAFQLFATAGSAGALNLYADRPHVFDDDTADTGALFAAQAALALQGAQRAAGLTIALENRDVIGQAKGILMERFGVGQSAAFAMLVESSQHTNMKLVDVATWLVTEVERRGSERVPAR
jgi:hypothetical protein